MDVYVYIFQKNPSTYEDLVVSLKIGTGGHASPSNKVVVACVKLTWLQI